MLDFKRDDVWNLEKGARGGGRGQLRVEASQERFVAMESFRQELPRGRIRHEPPEFTFFDGLWRWGRGGRRAWAAF